MSHLPFLAIPVASVLLIAFFVWYQDHRWRASWEVPRVSGTYVRCRLGAELTPLLRIELSRAIEVVTYVALHEFSADNHEVLRIATRFGIEVVPPLWVQTPTVPFGRLPGGAPAGGSVRIEKTLFRRREVAVVVTDRRQTNDAPIDRAADFVVHEVIQHLYSLGLGLGLNPGHHTNTRLNEIEDRAKEHLRRLRASHVQT